MAEKLLLGVIAPSIPVMVEFMVPVLEDAALASRVSALSNTVPTNIELYDPPCGVLGTVACTAGPRAALAGVIGIGAGLCNMRPFMFTPLDELLADIGTLPPPFDNWLLLAEPSEAQGDSRMA